MGFDLSVFISAGIQDALGPTQFAMAGVFAAMMLSLRQSRKRIALIAPVVFTAFLIVLGVMLDLKFFDRMVSAFGFLSQVKWLFLLLGLGFLLIGFLFLREWRILLSEKSRCFAAFIPVVNAGWLTGILLPLILAGGMVLLLNVWPVNYQVLLQSDTAFLPGMFFDSLIVLVVYEVFHNGAVLFIWLFFILARGQRNADFLRRKKSLLAIIASAFYVAVGGSLCFFFYVAATKPWL
jgi:hypothetical protein